MKYLFHIISVLVAACLILSMTVFAAEADSIAYTEGDNTIVIAADQSFTLTKVGQNMEGNPFELKVTGVVDENGEITITGLFDGDIDLTAMASEEQLAGDKATAEAMYKAATEGAKGEAEESPKTAKPGTYTDGTSTMVIGEDQTFTVTTVGQNMEGQDFELTLKGTISEEGELALTGIFDGDLDLTELASDEQKADNLAVAEALYAIALEESADAAGADDVKPGTYTLDKSVLKIAEDLTFVMITPGLNMEGNEFELTVTGEVSEAGEFTITGVYDGEFDLTQLASEEQLAENLATVQAVYAEGAAE